MARGHRRFTVQITETKGITVAEVGQALALLAERLRYGTASLEEGSVVSTTGNVIGKYKWETQFDLPGPRPTLEP